MVRKWKEVKVGRGVREEVDWEKVTGRGERKKGAVLG